MYFVICNRETVLSKMRTGGIGCEIGVWRGDNAQFIRDQVKPDRFYLIDPWRMGTWDDVAAGRGFQQGLPVSPAVIEAFKVQFRLIDPEYIGGEPDPVMEKIYQATCARFSSDKRVEIIREKSADVVNRFSDEYFDFIYIDGDHGFDAVYSDLMLYERKLKKGGIIIGNDYLCSPKTIHTHYGVIPACTMFCKIRGYKMIALTYGEYADFFLIKEHSEYVNHFLTNLIHSDFPVIEINDAYIANYQSKYFEHPATKRERFVPSL